jgi:hypothetical protein
MKRKKKIEPVEVKLIRTCEELMLDKFKHCLLKEEYFPLILSGQPSETELNDAWNTIISEYAQLSGSDKFERIVTLTKEINASIFKFNRVELYIRILAKAVDDPAMYSQVLIKELKRFGYPGQYDPKIKSRYLEELDAAYSKAKSLLVSAKLKQNELKRLEGQMEKGKVDSTHFDNNIIELSAHYKYQITEHNISTQKYCLMIRDMKQKIQLSNIKSYGRPAYTGNNK